MTVREALDVISGALDSLYEFYNDAEAEELFDEIGKAEAVIYELVKKEERPFEDSYAHCPECGGRLFYDEFEQDTEYCDEIVVFEAEGHCLKCQNTYTWTETFKLDEIKFDN